MIVKPNFVCGPHNVSPEHPSNWALDPISGIKKNVSLGGFNSKDVPWRKYSYRLVWDTMSLSDFQAMEDLVNYHNDNGIDIQFNYEKFTQSSSIRLVHIDLLSRDRAGGKGNTLYYQNVSVDITEVNPR